MIHLDITISWDSMESTSPPTLHDLIQEDQVSLHEQDQFNKMPGPSSKGGQWSIPPNVFSQITPIFLSRKS
jgi:hypothetical protein